MAMICDTGGIYALFDADDAHHQPTVACFQTERGSLY